VTGHLPCTCNQAQPGRYVVLSVQDTGVGMEREVLSHLFEPFFTTKEVGKGTGLGLSAVYGIVTQSGGHITVDSAPGRGSTFHVYLPAISDEVKKAAQEQAARRERPPRGTETVLVVEDADTVRDLAARILRDNGYTTLVAADGEAAERLCRSHSGPIHLLLTDVVMPGRLSGRDLAGRLRALRPELRVVYMSGYTDDLLGAYGVSTKTAFLYKPFTAHELLHRVRAALTGEPEDNSPEANG
jgi:two-component system cell cycle sensor histidine kinase/response regulator CckA